jgi:hypothetical protein
MKLDPKVLESLARLKTQEPNFIKWLEGRLEKCRDDAVMQRDDVSTRWAQGRAQELRDLLEAVNSAAEVLRKA